MCCAGVHAPRTEYCFHFSPNICRGEKKKKRARFSLPFPLDAYWPWGMSCDLYNGQNYQQNPSWASEVRAVGGAAVCSSERRDLTERSHFRCAAHFLAGCHLLSFRQPFSLGQSVTTGISDISFIVLVVQFVIRFWQEELCGYKTRESWVFPRQKMSWEMLATMCDSQKPWGCS